MLSLPQAPASCVYLGAQGLLVLTSQDTEKAGWAGAGGGGFWARLPSAWARQGRVRGQGSELSPQKLDARGPQRDDPAGQALLLGQWGRRGQLLGLHQAAGDAGGRRARPRRDHHPQAIVPAAPHGAPTGVHHEAHQEPRAQRVCVGLSRAGSQEGKRGQGRQPLSGHSPCVHRAGHGADVVRGLCGRAAGDQRVFIVLFGHLGMERGGGKASCYHQRAIAPADGPGQWTSRRGQGGSASQQGPSEGGAAWNSLTLWDKAHPESKRERGPPGTYTASPRPRTLGEDFRRWSESSLLSSPGLSSRTTRTSGLPPAPTCPVNPAT